MANIYGQRLPGLTGRRNKRSLQQEPRPPALHADATNSVPRCRCRADSVIMEKSGSRSRPLWEFQLTVRPRTKPATSHRTAG